jgi:tRNA 2-thiouridine synthesizing protein A
MNAINPNRDGHSSADEKPVINTLVVQGLACPLPLLRTKQALKAMLAGQHLLVLATDSGAWRDIPAFCQLAGHRVLERREVSGVYEFLIEKGG